VRLAAFEGGSWEMRDYLGGRGSVYPRFHADGRGVYVLHRTVLPASWDVLELDESGRVWRRATLAEPSRERPLLDRVETSRVSLRWPVRGAAAERRSAGEGRVAATGEEAADAPEDRVVEVEWQVAP
jgi:hypothetical protein